MSSTRRQTGATREGVFPEHFEFGLHGPLTLDGVPLNLAEDPVTGIKGYLTYINRNGGINGRKVQAHIIDDRYTTQGGQQAADQLVKEIKPFIISGTLGIDQIAKVAKAAQSRKIPYFAGGGPEPEMKDIGMFQTLSSYDQYANMVVDFICKYGNGLCQRFKSANDIRIATSTLNSENILPVEKRFVARSNKSKCARASTRRLASRSRSRPSRRPTTTRCSSTGRRTATRVRTWSSHCRTR